MTLLQFFIVLALVPFVIQGAIMAFCIAVAILAGLFSLTARLFSGG